MSEITSPIAVSPRTSRRSGPGRPARALARAGAAVLTTPEQVAEAADAWAAAPPPGLGPLTRPAWALAVARTLAPAGALRVVVVRDGPAVTAVAPLVVGAHGRLELLGARALPEPSDLVARDDAARAALARAVVALGRPLRLQRVPAGSPTPAALRAALGRRGLVAVRPADPWPTLALDPGWTAPEGRLSARRAGDLRRARRRAEALGPVAVEHHAPRPDGLPALLEEALEVEADGWKGAAGTALRHDAPLAAFFRAWAAGAAADGTLRLSLLRIGGTAAAMQLAAEADGRRWILKIGHRAAHARCSPGLLLLLETVRHAAARGLDAVELLGTVEPWTRAWTAEASPAVLVRAFPATPAGARRLTAEAVRAARRRAAGRGAGASA